LNFLCAQGYEGIPKDAELAELAEEVRRHCGQGQRGRVDFAAVCKAFGAALRVAELEGREGGEEAMLVPLHENRFGIVLDPTPRGGWNLIPRPVRQDLRRHRLRFRLGHELAHTFFYARRVGQTPLRRLFDSEEQEDFCDRFSRSLLVPQAQIAHMEPTAEGLVRLQRACDVSLEVAARAVLAARRELKISIWFERPDGTLKQQLGASGGQQLESDALPLPERRQWVTVTQS